MANTAEKKGWQLSKYNLWARAPGEDKTVIVNLLRGTCAVYTPLECAILADIENLPEDNPLLQRFADRGLIVNFDETAAISAMGRIDCSVSTSVSMTICPTIGCNFDCPYCFENHRSGRMSPETQAHVLGLARHMMEASRAKNLHVTWFGGEPLLVPDIIRSLSENLMALAEEKGAEYSAGIITNGYLLTEENIRMLEDAKVRSAQVTLDGLGEAHNATRPLAGGGPTFERIIQNLRENKIGFRISIRHNVHEGNRGETDKLRKYVEDVARESGNNIVYYSSPVSASDTADARGSDLELLDNRGEAEVLLIKNTEHFSAGRGSYCGANLLFSIVVDDLGRLYKCYDDVDKPERSFGTAEKWKVTDPLRTADHPDMLTGYLNTASPLDDMECRKCIWLPACAGGCPNNRLFEKHHCVPYRDTPEQYVLALYEKLKQQQAEKTTDAQESRQNRARAGHAPANEGSAVWNRKRI